MSWGLLTEDRAKIAYDRFVLEKVRGDDLDILGRRVDTTRCLHDKCPNCGGSGVRKDGLGVCFHGIACPCPKCSFTC